MIQVTRDLATENGGSALTPEGGTDQRFLVFTLAQETYAVPLLKVKEVLAPAEITPLPQAPAHFKGIMNLRGQVISVLDLRLKFKVGNGALGSECAIIILDIENAALGVIVDSIESVLAVEAKDISPPPSMNSSLGSDFLLGVTRHEKRLVLLLKIENALNVEDFKTIREAA